MSGQLTIDLEALAHNYAEFHLGNPGRVAAVIKADAYGLGAPAIAKKLWAEGCREFFVAFADEGRALRAVLPQARIYVLAGISPEVCERDSINSARPGQRKNQPEKLKGIDTFLAHKLTPVLNTVEQCRYWSTTSAPAAIHVDTGMARLGMAVESVVQDISGLNLNVELLISHFARADEFDHSFSGLQSQRLASAYHALSKQYPRLRLSLANSAGSLSYSASTLQHSQDTGIDYLDRAGIGLYGSNPFSAADAQHSKNLKPVVSLHGQVLQVRQVAAGTPVGYGSTHIMPKASRLAILDVGYADGLPRLLSNNGHAYFAGELCNIVGRISMDATTVDVGQLSVAEGDWLELIGAQISVDKVAGQAQTIAYEVFTGLSQRLTKVYIED